mmetsp:Transcript_76280/g.215907  ORF Transcript_76280/g.215907 Transcript_76280/m.215907 type:complete len:243 (+) Transcript_76280:1172-1900(+)
MHGHRWQVAALNQLDDRRHDALELLVERVAECIGLAPMSPQRLPQPRQALRGGVRLLAHASHVLEGIVEGCLGEAVEAGQGSAEGRLHLRGEVALARGLQAGLGAGDDAPQHHCHGGGPLLRRVQGLVHGRLKDGQPDAIVRCYRKGLQEHFLQLDDLGQVNVQPGSDAVQGRAYCRGQGLRSCLVQLVVFGRLPILDFLLVETLERNNGIITQDPGRDVPDGAGLEGVLAPTVRPSPERSA